MTITEREKLKELLSKIMPGFKAAKDFFDAYFDDNLAGTIVVGRPKMTKALEDADKAINELKLYVSGFNKEEKNES